MVQILLKMVCSMTIGATMSIIPTLIFASLVSFVHAKVNQGSQKWALERFKEEEGRMMKQDFPVVCFISVIVCAVIAYHL